MSECDHVVVYPGSFAPSHDYPEAYESDGTSATVSAWVEITELTAPVRTFLCTQCGDRKTEEYEEEEWPWT